jgi:hypothetical protein
LEGLPTYRETLQAQKTAHGWGRLELRSEQVIAEEELERLRARLAVIKRERAGADDQMGSIHKMIGNMDSRLAKYRALLKGKATGVGLGLEGFESLEESDESDESEI